MDTTSLSIMPNFSGKTVCGGRIRMVELLGEGTYGVVYSAVDNSEAGSSSSTASPSSSSSSALSGSEPTPKQYAVKIMEKAQPNTLLWKYQQGEISTHLRVQKHKNIVSVHNVYEDPFVVYIVLEYCAGGTLLEAMIDRLVYAGNDELIRSVFVQLLDAVQHCHQRGVYHRDLKPDNVLINEDGTDIRLADFGLATTTNVGKAFGCGSLPYMSPGELRAAY